MVLNYPPGPWTTDKKYQAYQTKLHISEEIKRFTLQWLWFFIKGAKSRSKSSIVSGKATITFIPIYLIKDQMYVVHHIQVYVSHVRC